MIINIRVDHTIADIETMEIVDKDLNNLFNQLTEKFNIKEYIEISTCNRHEYYIHTDFCSYDEPLLNNENKNIIIEYGNSAIIHLFRMTSGLESMIIGEDQILGQIKDSKQKSEKENHCGKVLDILFTKAIHVGQVVRKETKINQGSISMGSAAVDLAEEHLGNLQEKAVLVIGAGKMGKLVAKALAEKNLKAIFVANRTYYKAVKLAKELDGEAILIDDMKDHLTNADLVISATGAPHAILTKERVELSINSKSEKTVVMIDIANPRDISEDVKELGINLFNIDDLRGIAEKNKKLRENEAKEAENIIQNEYDLLKDSFKLMEVENILSDLRISMEDIRQRESQKAIVKLDDVDVGGKTIKTMDKMTKSIVNKIFFDISSNIKKAAKEDNKDIIKTCETIFKK